MFHPDAESTPRVERLARCWSLSCGMKSFTFSREVTAGAALLAERERLDLIRRNPEEFRPGTISAETWSTWLPYEIAQIEASIMWLASLASDTVVQ